MIRYQVQTNIAGEWHRYGAGRLYRDRDAAHRRLGTAIAVEDRQDDWRSFFRIAVIEVPGTDRLRRTAYKSVAQQRHDRVMREWHNMIYGGRW